MLNEVGTESKYFFFSFESEFEVHFIINKIECTIFRNSFSKVIIINKKWEVLRALLVKFIFKHFQELSLFKKYELCVEINKIQIK